VEFAEQLAVDGGVARLDPGVGTRCPVLVGEVALGFLGNGCKLGQG
jgi:hypothetical protein